VPEEIVEIARVLERAGHETWCVGGALRDTLLGDPHSDFDLATSARPRMCSGSSGAPRRSGWNTARSA